MPFFPRKTSFFLPTKSFLARFVPYLAFGFLSLGFESGCILFIVFNVGTCFNCQEFCLDERQQCCSMLRAWKDEFRELLRESRNVRGEDGMPSPTPFRVSIFIGIRRICCPFLPDKRGKCCAFFFCLALLSFFAPCFFFLEFYFS